MENDLAKIKSIILVKGHLLTVSPLCISNGNHENTDHDLLVDKKGLPFIPGSAWAGSLYDYMTKEYPDNVVDIDELWGQKDHSSGKNPQSALITHDSKLVSTECNIENRTSVKIDGKRKTSTDHSLFNYEILPAGNTFRFSLELKIRDFHNYDNLKNIFYQLISDISHGRTTIGGMSTSGFGEIILTEPKIAQFEFPETRIKWLSGDFKWENFKPSQLISRSNSSIALIKLDLDLNNSINIREEYKGENKNIDSQHISSAGQPIIPGTSIKGVIRHQAKKILNTLHNEEPSMIIDRLFGYIQKDKSSAQKGRVYVNEAVIKNGIDSTQSRIKVSPFTGGTIRNALFTEKLIWADKNCGAKLLLRLEKPELFEMGLLLQVIKDLWTGRLPIGGEANIGRGRFTGKLLSIDYMGKSVSVERVGNELQINDSLNFLKDIEEAWESFVIKENSK